MKGISVTSLPNNCWIFEKHSYRFLSDGNDLLLPNIPAKYECLLKANDIPYRKVHSPTLGDICEYWSSSCFEEKVLAAPLYAKMPDASFRYCGKLYTGEVVSERTVQLAKDVQQDFIEAEIKKYDNILCEVEKYQYAKQQLAGRLGTMCNTTLFSMRSDSFYEIEMNHDKFVVSFLNVHKRSPYFNWVAIFDKGKILRYKAEKKFPSDFYTDFSLEVPKELLGIVIGKGGQNIKAWSEFLEVDYIKVVPSE